MDFPIVTIEQIKAKARDAFYAGRGRDSHGMNLWAPALEHWLEEYDRVAADAQQKEAA